jgi:hypothetical protein
MSNSYYKGNLASQPPLRKINTEYYNPFVHTPPTGLDKNITLRSLGPRQPVTVSQKNIQEYKPGEDANKEDDYGQFVEIGGKKRRRRTKTRKSSKRKRSSKRKSSSKRKRK